MYGFKLRTLVWGIFAMVSTTYLTFFGDHPSWSQNASHALWFLLNFVLIAIAESFSQLAAHHPKREQILFRWFGTRIRFEHLSRFTQYSFYAILIFHLGNDVFPDIWHMIATGLGVLGLFLLILGGWNVSEELLVFLVSICIAAFMLIGAFAFKWWEVGYGEYALALVGFMYQRKII